MLKVRSSARLFFLTLMSACLIGCNRESVCAGRANDTQEKLLECVTAAGVREHLAAFQAIADEHGGNRATGTAGYQASVDYVVDKLTGAGYEVTRHSFEFMFEPPNVLLQHEPIDQRYAAGIIIGSGSGEVRGRIIPVNRSGCEATDFAGLDFSGASDIALLEEGACTQYVKARNAEVAGAEAMIFLITDAFGIGMGIPVGRVAQTPDDTSGNFELPIVAVSRKHAVDLVQEGSEALVRVTLPVEMTQSSLLAELPGDENGSVVMVGAHLDSVFDGPGISDNASGSAVILETAMQMANVAPHNTVRFAWWGAEETQPYRVGSETYVASLSQEELNRISLYLNLDMIASPNSVFFVYDGTTSDDLSVASRWASSADITSLFASYYTDFGLPFERLNPDRHSDHAPFMAQGIPVGALNTGAEGLKTDEQASIFGGTTGESYDPCYHKACDTLDNINLDALDVNADAAAMATLYYAMKTD